MLNNVNKQSGVKKLAVSVAEAAIAISVSETFVRRRIRNKELRAISVGRRTLVLMKDLETFLEKQGEK